MEEFLFEERVVGREMSLEGERERGAVNEELK